MMIHSSGDITSGNDSQFKGNDYFHFIEKLQLMQQMCQYLFQNPERIFLELTNVLGDLTSTILAILQVKLHCCFRHQQQIQALKKNGYKCY